MAISDEVSPTESEEELVLQAVAGSRRAFGTLYESHVSRVYRHIFYLLRDPAEAEDLTAQTFLKAWEAVERYEYRGAPFVNWLQRIAHNLTLSHLRSKRKHIVLGEDDEPDAGRRVDPEQVVERGSEGDELRRVIAHLPPAQQQVIILRFAEDLDVAEVGKALGKSVGAVRVIQHRALRNMKRIILEGRLP